jgi:hypothetical protein
MSVAEFIYDLSRQRIAELKPDDVQHTIVQVAFDETEMTLKMKGRIGIHHVIVSHMHVFRRYGDSSDSLTQELEIPLPMLVLPSTSAQSVWSAISRFLPDVPRSPGSRSALIINSDKASGCVRAGVHAVADALENGTFALFSNCAMHMVFASLAAAIQPLDLIGPMYCGTVLLHRGNNIRALRHAIHSLVKDRLDISFEAVDHDDRNAQVIELIDAADRCTAKQLGRSFF